MIHIFEIPDPNLSLSLSER